MSDNLGREDVAHHTAADTSRHPDRRRHGGADHLAVRPARDGDPEPIAFEETDTIFKIVWPGNYRINGPAFIYSDRQSRRVSTILGYPTQILAAPEPH